MLFLHSRILHPLNDLRQLLERLSEENYTPIAIDHLDPLLFPVFNSYNEMVIHLAELEEAKRLYAQSMQRDQRLAGIDTHSLKQKRVNKVSICLWMAVWHQAVEIYRFLAKI